jgi:uncharacterized lipoprotein YddW (UPF0748 family)
MTTSKLCPSLLSPWEGEDPAFRRTGRLPNLRYGDQVRAVWVTRYDFHTDSDVMRIMHQSAQAGFNTVFFQVLIYNFPEYLSDSRFFTLNLPALLFRCCHCL